MARKLTAEQLTDKAAEAMEMIAGLAPPSTPDRRTTVTEVTPAALILLGAVANDRVIRTGGYFLHGKQVSSRIGKLRQQSLVVDGRYIYHGKNEFPDYSIVELTEDGRKIVELAHPFPWRGICTYCGKTLERAGWDRTWVMKTLHGREVECLAAPTRDGDPGHHDPRVALSASGYVDDKC